MAWGHLRRHLAIDMCVAIRDGRFLKWADEIGAEKAVERRKLNSGVCWMEYGGLRFCGFPASNDKWDWVLNLMRFRVAGVHAGFLGTWTMINGITPAADCYVGHSQGAALATLACSKHGGTLYTFGSPRVFSRKKAKRFNAAHKMAYRVALDRDPVTWVPLRIFGYEHVGRPFIYRYTGPGNFAHHIYKYKHEMKRVEGEPDEY